jgi:hypothetical protein
MNKKIDDMNIRQYKIFKIKNRENLKRKNNKKVLKNDKSKE